MVQHPHGSTRGLGPEAAFFLPLVGLRDRVLVAGPASISLVGAMVSVGHPVRLVVADPAEPARLRSELGTDGSSGILETVVHDFARGPVPGSDTVGIAANGVFNLVLERPETWLRHLADSLFVHHNLYLDLFFPATRHDPDLDGQWMRTVREIDGRTITISERISWNARKGLEELVRVVEDSGARHETRLVRRYWAPAKVAELLAPLGYGDFALAPGHTATWNPRLTEQGLSRGYVLRARR